MLATCGLLGGAFLTRQIQTTYLSRTIHEQTLAQRSIAVLPLLDLDEANLNPEAGSILATSLTNVLQRNGPVRVIAAAPQDSSAAFSSAANVRTAARAYNTRTVLSGSYRSAPGGIQTTVRLTDAEGNLLLRKNRTAAHLSQALADISASDARQIFSLLDQKSWEAIGSERDDAAFRNERARDLLLAGRELTQRQSADDLARAIECFRKALQTEPNSILARTELVRAITTRTHYVFNADLLGLANEMAREATHLNASSGETHRALASILFHTGRPKESLQEIQQFLELNGPDVPSIALAGSLWRIVGRPDKALKWFGLMAQWQRRPAEDIWIIGDCWADMEDDATAETIYRRASELHPQLPDGWVGLCHLKLLNGDFAGARQLCDQNKELYPESVYPRQMAAQVEFFSRNFAEAEKLYSQLSGSDPAGGRHFYGAVSYESALGRIRLETGDTAGGRAFLATAEEKEIAALASAPDHPEILYRLAALEASKGDTAAALVHLRAAKNAGWLDYRSMALDPRFDALRSESPYQEIAREMRESVNRRRILTQARPPMGDGISHPQQNHN